MFMQTWQNIKREKKPKTSKQFPESLKRAKINNPSRIIRTYVQLVRR